MIRERLKANLFINQKKFQSNTNHLLADRTGYIVNWLEHMFAWEGGGPCPMRSKVNNLNMSRDQDWNLYGLLPPLHASTCICSVNVVKDLKPN